ncbi:hypothetical protein FSP39_001197 [Pinctada imbricata]|uniref:PDZ domain-containing protein n=1 Tax=Pinctada imbricata TaxID=66713 RepID=A0AA89C9K5_PINIB|nr:hypothetical protein FSP39_001197 [Pinctada imbricata]
MAGTGVVQLHRQSSMEPWGFRLQGGRDYRQQLCVKKVNPGTPSAGQLAPGDTIVGINNANAQAMTHMQAQTMIKNSGNNLALTVMRGYGGPDRIQSIAPKGPVKFQPRR